MGAGRAPEALRVARFLALHLHRPSHLKQSVVVTVRCIHLVLNWNQVRDNRSPNQIQPSARPPVDARDTLGFGPAVVK